MSKREQLLFKLIENYELKEYDIINLNFVGLDIKKNNKPSIKNNIIPTLTTNCNIAIVLKGEENE